MGRPSVALPLLLAVHVQSAPEPAPEELAQRREAAREALRPTCGRCHDGAQPTARPAALRVFDLRDTDWSARITDVQMDHIEGRFEGFHLPEADRVIVRRFLEVERARRAALPTAAASDAGPGH
jgi:hypothetical protein